MRKQKRKLRPIWIGVAYLFVLALLTLSAFGLVTMAEKEESAPFPDKRAAGSSEIALSTADEDMGKEEDQISDPAATDDDAKEKEGRAIKEEQDKKKIALTFDDGPHPEITPQILKILKKYDAKATFFMLGSMAHDYPDVAKEVQLESHEIGNHTWDHPDLTKTAKGEIQRQISVSSDIIEQVTGQRPTAFRPPYGAFNDAVRQQTDLPMTLWDIDTLDWKDRNAGLLLANIKKAAKDGGTILMHDIYQSTADGLDAVLTYLQNEGYSFVGVSEL